MTILCKIEDVKENKDHIILKNDKFLTRQSKYLRLFLLKREKNIDSVHGEDGPWVSKIPKMPKVKKKYDNVFQISHN